MRLRELDLLRFGPFTGERLTFEPEECGLHIVFGANEAGKSSALRALTQMLYGIPHNSSDNFVHAHQDLRIGAELAAPNGEVLRCVRRKGRKNTLRDGDDVEVVNPGELAALLGEIDEQSFSQRFALGHGELVEGGEAIVEGGGDLAKMLFAAASGAAHLNRVQQQLAEQADELFKARASVKPLNKALAELKQQKKIVKDAQLSTSAYDKQRQTVDEAEQKLTLLDEQLLAKKTELARLERFAAALPDVFRRTALLEELAVLADAPLLPADFADQRREAQSELSAAIARRGEAQKALGDIAKKIDESPAPAALLDHAEAIEDMHVRSGAYKKARSDGPGLASRRRQLEGEARDILRQLGRGDVDLDQAESLRVDAARRVRIGNLGAEQQAHIAAREQAHKQSVDLSRRIEETERELAKLNAPRDTQSLQTAIRRSDQQGDLSQRLADANQKLDAAIEQAGIDLKKLPDWSGSLDEAEQLAVPDAETVDRFEAEFAAADTRCRDLHKDANNWLTRLAELTEQLQQLCRQFDTPTVEDLTAARQKRDDGWRLIVQSRFDGADVRDAEAAFIAQFPPAADLPAAYRASVLRADEIADRLRREAKQVAEKAEYSNQRDAAEERVAAVDEELATAQSEQQKLQNAWRELWRPLKVEPLAPREMRGWLTRQQALAAASAEIRRRRGEVEQLQQKMGASRDDLRRALADAAGQAPEESLALAQWIDRAEHIVAEQNELQKQHSGLSRDLSNLRQQARAATDALANAEENIEQWRRQWAGEIQPLGLPAEAQPAEANVVLDRLGELFDKLKESAALAQREQAIDEDCQSFENSAQELLRVVAADMADAAPEQAIPQLSARLAEARQTQAKLDELRQQQSVEQQRLKAAGDQNNELTAVLETLCREAQCEKFDELAEAERRSQQRRTCESQLRDAEERLQKLGAGAGLQEFARDAAAQNVDELPPKIFRLKDDITQDEQDRAQLLTAIGRERSELDRMNGGAQAAEAEEEAQHLLARIRSDAEQYIRLRLAAAVLRGAIERYREKHQGPVLQKASELFAELTLGSFEGLRPDFDDDGGAVLVGVRRGGRTVGVDGMSDGACDQLYLALRLASLWEYLDNGENEPLPFVIDDLLIRFDDDRSVAALKAIAQLAEKTQVIFFTHHEHLLALAEENLPDDAFAVHRLPGDFAGREPVRRASEPVEAARGAIG